MLKTVEVVEKSKNINAHVQQEHGMPNFDG